MKQIIFLRHGETAHNNERVFQSDDAVLNDKGRDQVKHFLNTNHELLAGAETVLHSPLVRAKQTAKIIADATSLKLELNEALLELKNPPEIRGKSYDDRMADSAYMDWRSNLHKLNSLGLREVENYYDLQQRAREVLKRLVDRDESCMLAVSHSEFIRTIVACVLLGDNADSREVVRIMETLKLGNAKYVVLELEDKSGRWRVVL